ncbi:MAG: alpha/beta fold hydrolase [Ferruginibacter sp.]
MEFQKNLVQGYIRLRLQALMKLNPSFAGKELFRLFCTPISRYREKAGLAFTQGKNLHFSLKEKKIHGYLVNEGAARTVLILHGWTSSLAKFEHLVTPLTDAGYAVLAFDAPAHGFSEGELTHAMDYADMIKEAGKQFGPVHAFIGHSFGGLAICLALEAEPVLQDDARLVLIAPAAETHTALDNVFTFLSLKDPLLRTAINDEIKKESGKEVSWFSIARAIKNIHIPVLFLQDETDFITPLKDIEPIRLSGQQNIKFKISRGLGHQKIYRDPQTIQEIIAFLK